MKFTKVAKKYLLIFFAGILFPYALVFGLLMHYDPEGFLIIIWTPLLPVVVFPIWMKRLKKAKAKEISENNSGI